jgi:hypothetical protein
MVIRNVTVYLADKRLTGSRRGQCVSATLVQGATVFSESSGRCKRKGEVGPVLEADNKVQRQTHLSTKDRNCGRLLISGGFPFLLALADRTTPNLLPFLDPGISCREDTSGGSLQQGGRQHYEP